MAVPKLKPPLASPTFEKINRELLKSCAQTAESAKRAIETSKKLTEEAQGLVDHIRSTRRKAR